MDYEKVVRQVMLAAVKSRSIAAEGEYSDVAAMLDPILYDTSDFSLLNICEHVLDNRIVTAQDAMNVLFLAGKSEHIRLMYALRWEEVMPEPMDVFGKGK